MDSQLKAVTLFCIATCISIFLDIPVARQIFGFLFLSFIPGFLLLRLVKLREKNTIETVLFSAGLSISFLMFAGFFVNQFYVSLNLSGLLSTPLLVVVIGSAFVLLALCYFTKSEEHPLLCFDKKRLITASWITALCLLPIIGVVGALYHSSLLTMVMILGIVALFVLGVTWRRVTPEKVFPLLILSASVALLFNTVLISKYVIGSDVFSEFYVYKTVIINGFWRPSGPMLGYTLIDSLNSLLSITILPVVYTSVTGISGNVLFKIFYPFVFSLVPLALYRMYEQQIDKKSALLSVFFFMSLSIAFFGLEPLSLDRQIVGEFFFIMAILLLSGSQSDYGKKQILIIVFGASVVVSHYSMAYVLLIYLIALFALSRINVFPFRKASMKSLYLGTVVLMAVLTFSWYMYISSSPLNQLQQSINRITSSFTADFGNPAATGFNQGALQSASPLVTTTILGYVDKALTYLENLLIIIGIFALIVKPDEFNINPKYKLVALLSAILLLLGFVLPNLASTLNGTRIYAILVPFLAPFVVLGCTFTISFIHKYVSRHNNRIKRLSTTTISLCILTFLLVGVFLFQTGFIGHITDGYPYSYSLDLQRRESSNDISINVATHSGYFLETEVLSSTWLQENINAASKVYADDNSINTVLKAYAHLPNDRCLSLSHGFSPSPGTYVYLKYLNVRTGLVSVANGDAFNTSELQSGLDKCGQIYSNGDSGIYYSP